MRQKTCCIRTALIVRPKHKHIVLPSWVEECIDEETLMNEDGEHTTESGGGAHLQPTSRSSEVLSGSRPFVRATFAK